MISVTSVSGPELHVVEAGHEVPEGVWRQPAAGLQHGRAGVRWSHPLLPATGYALRSLSVPIRERDTSFPDLGFAIPLKVKFSHFFIPFFANFSFFLTTRSKMNIFFAG